MRRAALALALAPATLWAGCSQPSAGDMPQIQFGRQACQRCGMLLSEAAFASGYVDAEGDTVAFDDVGEMLSAVAAEPALAEVMFVNDFGGRGWIPARLAVYVRAPDFQTPMGTGFAAFRDRAQAERFAVERKGSVLEAASVLAPGGPRA